MKNPVRPVCGALLTLSLGVASLGVAMGHPVAAADGDIEVKVTQRDLVPRCVNGRPVEAGTRQWRVEPGPMTLAFSMRGQERPGRPLPDPGTAEVTFTAEAGHRYEVEVRADSAAFSARAWTAREWIPVVRDRSTDRIVSDAARWVGPACQPASPASALAAP
jgi:hypothetical protein